MTKSIDTSSTAAAGVKIKRDGCNWSAREYLSERDDKQATEKRVFRIIFRSDETNGAKLREALQSELSKIDLTSIVDR